MASCNALNGARVALTVCLLMGFQIQPLVQEQTSAKFDVSPNNKSIPVKRLQRDSSVDPNKVVVILSAPKGETGQDLAAVKIFQKNFTFPDGTPQVAFIEVFATPVPPGGGGAPVAGTDLAENAKSAFGQVTVIVIRADPSIEQFTGTQILTDVLFTVKTPAGETTKVRPRVPEGAGKTRLPRLDQDGNIGSNITKIAKGAFVFVDVPVIASSEANELRDGFVLALKPGVAGFEGDTVTLKRDFVTYLVGARKVIKVSWTTFAEVKLGKLVEQTKGHAVISSTETTSADETTKDDETLKAAEKNGPYQGRYTSNEKVTE